MNGSRASCLRSRMAASTFHLRGMQEQEMELNQYPQRKDPGHCLTNGYHLFTVLLWHQQSCGRQSAEELTISYFMSQMTKELLPRSDSELELPTLSSHGKKYPSKTMAPLALTQSGEGSVCRCSWGTVGWWVSLTQCIPLEGKSLKHML